MLENRIFIFSKCLPTEYISIIKEAKIALQKEIRHDLKLIITLTSSVMGQTCATDLMHRVGHNIM